MPDRAAELAAEARLTRLVITDAEIPSDHRILEGVDAQRVAQKGPTFHITELGKVFFARSSSWIRLHEKLGHFILDGEPVAMQREIYVNAAGKKMQRPREYNLIEVELMAYALACNMVIDHKQLTHALHVVSAMAKMYQLVPED